MNFNYFINFFAPVIVFLLIVLNAYKVRKIIKFKAKLLICLLILLYIIISLPLWLYKCNEYEVILRVITGQCLIIMLAFSAISRNFINDCAISGCWFLKKGVRLYFDDSPNHLRLNLIKSIFYLAFQNLWLIFVTLIYVFIPEILAIILLPLLPSF